MQTIVHYSLHFIAPGIIAWFFFRQKWKLVWGLFIATMLVDLDHLLASPIFDPNRCSIGFHPLHHPIPILLYLLLTLLPYRNLYIRVIAIGLLFHMLTDLIDCIWLFSECSICWKESKIYEYLR